MSKIIDRINAAILEDQSPVQQPNQYVAEIEVQMFGRGAEDEYVDVNSKVRVNYFIEIDHRSWGIKDINISPIGTIEVPYSISRNPSGADEVTTEHTVMVELSKIKQEVMEGSGVWIQSLELYLLPDGSVDYKRSELNVVKC